MICKQRNPAEHPAPSDRTARAGVDAETQLAFYLDRAFGDHPEIAVFNDIRLVDQRGSVAQVDHLVLHPFGFVVIESKSITGRVRINARREWVRVKSGGEEGMPDAVQQARLQRDVLKRLLGANAAKLRPGVAGGFDPLGFDVLAAISDRGIIERELPLEKVKKADQIPAAVQAIIRARKELLEKSPAGGGRLSPPERSAVVAFLLAAHTPQPRAPARKAKPEATRARPATPRDRTGRRPAPAPPTPSPAANRCPSCGGANLEMRWGERPRGYYFHCLGCGKNWKPDFTCPACHRPDVFPRQSKGTFLQECPCGHSQILHRNA